MVRGKTSNPKIKIKKRQVAVLELFCSISSTYLSLILLDSFALVIMRSFNYIVKIYY